MGAGRPAMRGAADPTALAFRSGSHLPLWRRASPRAVGGGWEPPGNRRRGAGHPRSRGRNTRRDRPGSRPGQFRARPPRGPGTRGRDTGSSRPGRGSVSTGGGRDPGRGERWVRRSSHPSGARPHLRSGGTAGMVTGRGGAGLAVELSPRLRGDGARRSGVVTGRSPRERGKEVPRHHPEDAPQRWAVA